MERRTFIRLAGAATVAAPWISVEAVTNRIDLRDCIILTSNSPSAREATAVDVFLEEAEKRCGIRWARRDQVPSEPTVTIFALTRSSTRDGRHPIEGAVRDAQSLQAEGFILQTGESSGRGWIAVIGADDRGLLFGLGKLLRLIEFEPEHAGVDAGLLTVRSQPKYCLRGHQLGYRPKTNSYDGWTVAMWDEYIRDLALFGTNAIELVPPRSDDAANSPLFPLPPSQMMVEMSRIADRYGLDVWIWYPALDRDYSNSATVEFALGEWGHIFSLLPRIDAVFVPGGDPGSTPPKELFALIERQKQNLRSHHPKAQMWVSPQGFNEDYTSQFYSLLREDSTKQWLDGVVFGPMSRLSVQQMRAAVPEKYPIRCYPDITHSVWCQFPVPSWDIAYALTEGREVINPRPLGQAEILKDLLPNTIGFISYSEGCNDDVNKFVWSGLSWSPDMDMCELLHEYANYFLGTQQAEGFANGLLDLEANWAGSLAANSTVEITLERFRDMERTCSPMVLANWRFQQALFRAYFDAYVRRRLINESAHVEHARDQLERILEIGWAPVAMGASPPAKDSISNGFDPEMLLASAQETLEESALHPGGSVLRTRLAELGEALYQSIRMQLAVERYRGEAVRRGADLDTVDHFVTDTMWTRRQIIEIRAELDPVAKLTRIRELLFRTDPGPGGFYDELGNPSNRPHLLNAQHDPKDPGNRITPIVDSMYPDTLQDKAPIAWKHWIQSMYESPVLLRYDGLDPKVEYHLRIVYGGDEPKEKIRLMANDHIEIHPLILRTWPPAPQEFKVPTEATGDGTLTLAWTAEPGRGNDGRGCQIAEVFLIPK